MISVEFTISIICISNGRQREEYLFITGLLHSAPNCCLWEIAHDQIGRRLRAPLFFGMGLKFNYKLHLLVPQLKRQCFC